MCFYIGGQSSAAEVEVVAHRHGKMVVEHTGGGVDGVWNDTSYLLVSEDELSLSAPIVKKKKRTVKKYSYETPEHMPA